MKPSSDFDLKQIFNVLHTRKGVIFVTTVVIFILTAYGAMNLPDIYRSSILILISPQRLPASYVTSTVTTTIEQRIRSVSAEILSRTTLEKVVREFNLYPPKAGLDIDARVERLRKKIQIDVRNNDSFRLSFESESPERAMQITARLGAIFIDENLQVREQQAVGTSSFISAEADRVRTELESKEIDVNQFKAKYRNELPEQLDGNLRTLQQLRTELQNNTLRLSSVQERKASLEQQVVEAESLFIDLPFGREMEGPLRSQPVHSLKVQLDNLLRQYSERHPDVIRLKKEIESSEAQAAIQQTKTKGKENPSSSVNPLKQTILAQIEDLTSEINALRSTNGTLRTEIASYQARVDNTPIRAIDLAKISRTYEITLKKYQDLLAKSFDSQLSQNMEQQQKGERFRLVDPAYLPEAPVRPNRLVIVLLGLLAGLGGGVGLAFLQENMDTSFKRGEDLDGYVQAPLLATLPAVTTRGSVLEQRRTHQILALASVAVVTVGLILIHLFGSSLAGF